MFGTGPGQSNDHNIGGVQQYLGPAIIATVNRPVRILFRNQLPLSNQTITNGMTGQSDTPVIARGTDSKIVSGCRKWLNCAASSM